MDKFKYKSLIKLYISMPINSCQRRIFKLEISDKYFL